MSKEVMKPRRAKTFTGCWTCRSRKVKCDLRRPGCIRCAKSGLECGGYDIKLRWSHLVKFDPYGVQITPATRVPRVKDEPHYQRRNIDFVRYKEEYVFHEDMDDELSTLHAPPPDKIKDGKTWIIKKFGVFRGTENAESQYLPRKKRKKVSKPAMPTKISDPNVNIIVQEPKQMEWIKSKSNSGPGSPIADVDTIDVEPQEVEKRNSTVTDPNNVIFQQPKAIKSKPISENTNNNEIEFQHSEKPDDPLINLPGHQFIPDELKEDILLSAFAIQGTQISDNFNSNNLETQLKNSNILTSANANDATEENNTNDSSDQGFQQLMKYLFHPKGSIANGLNENFPIYTQFENERDQINDKIFINAPNNESKMPRTIMEILPSELTDTTILDKLQVMNPNFVIPKTGLFIHGLARFLLTHYINNVADIMTVTRVAKNPWKNLYFTRALRALGDLAGLGYTSNSRNSLLNALLAVSCLHIKGKFEKNSQQQKFFLNLGIELRCQAASFLNLCLKETVKQEKYKDVLVAILSMNSIDVVWGTMTECYKHLTIGEQFVEKRIIERPKLSKKAKLLHRIFSFLKLLQDSTALDKINENEVSIHVIENNNENSSSSKLDSGKDDSVTTSPNSDSSKPGVSKLSAPIFATMSSENFTGFETSTNLNELGADSIYGLPNSLIVLFSDCVHLVRHTEYYNMKYIPLPRELTDLSLRFEKTLLKWSCEWKFHKDTSKEFISDEIEGIYHHTMSFYFGLIIYYFTMARSLNNDFLQNYVERVLFHLQKINEMYETKTIQIVPLSWQGFIAGCSCTSQEKQQQFREWAAKLAEHGLGSYWGARQIMFEVWRRRKREEQDDNWYSVYKDWEMNLMLA